MQAFRMFVLLVASVGIGRAADFEFSNLGLNEIATTIATIGKFNVMVSPELGAALSYSRQGIEPYDALVEVAKQADVKVTKIAGMATDSYVLSKHDLPGDLNTPAATEGAFPTDFNFKDVEVSAVVSTFAVLGKFQAGVAEPIASRKVTLRLQQVIPNQGFYWLAAMLDARIEETDGEGGAKKLMLVPR